MLSIGRGHFRLMPYRKDGSKAQEFRPGFLQEFPACRLFVGLAGLKSSAGNHPPPFLREDEDASVADARHHRDVANKVFGGDFVLERHGAPLELSRKSQFRKPIDVYHHHFARGAGLEPATY